MSTKGKVIGIVSNLVTVEVDGPVAENELCHITLDGTPLLSEVIKVNGNKASVQVFESTRGLKNGDEVEFLGRMLEVTLGPGLLSSVYDGLQNNLTTMETEAFAGGAFTYVLVPAGVERINNGTFANCPSLQYVEIQGAQTTISDNAFGSRTDFTIIAPTGSAAATWANQHNVNFIPAA